ncbi:hypothetical protein D3H55_21490 [Bacillus salacetis]|uniref:DUF4129 domain-containing protein n=1 Tax=Bacillus salacetis TaxID=2315464 RepID=A0A3A1QT80_9BACI|nr:hypothetical protein [Bacillus salacetis]RIW28551.1 hypothetical protein D3H55_21490 [Bacillus salacetis]
MKDKILVILIFAAMAASLGYMLSGTTISISEGVKSFYKNKQEELIAESDPLVIYAEDVRDGRELDWDPDEGLRRVIIIGDLPFPRLYGEGGFSVKDAAKLLGFLVPFCLLFIYWFRLYRKKQQKQGDDRKALTGIQQRDPHTAVTGENSMDVPSAKAIHEIRTLLKEWESNLAHDKKKRYQETISEWFKRINGPASIIPIYEKVRYGYGECTMDEYKLIKKILSAG